MNDEPSPMSSAAPTPPTGPRPKILEDCLRSEEAFDKAMKAGDPLIMEALTRFNSAGEMDADRSPRPSSMEQDTMIEQALEGFRRSLGK